MIGFQVAPGEPSSPLVHSMLVLSPTSIYLSSCVARVADRLHVLVMLGRVAEMVVVLVSAVGSEVTAVDTAERRRRRALVAQRLLGSSGPEQHRDGE